ncbi:unnamed protein product [Psylliodes chrysocephalus]|uniref:THAP-type domain-containing protein n=1 Tax=Psylliodes chrysocephalus TaxID=3402493 RepID=A0A9P0D088_9CUCU|nr:unnamed protein product [Psylliodes chrysocephala]
MIGMYKNIILLCLFTSSFQKNVSEILTKDLRVALPSGDYFPMVGFGTSKILGTAIVRNALDQALAAGYRLFDTAQVYGNEEDIGKALKELFPKHNLTRKDVFITSKLPAREYVYLEKKAYATLQQSLKNLNLDYLDLYLIHFPGIPMAETGLKDVNYSKIRNETWEQLAKGVKNGLVRNIGVSNYNVRHLTELINNDHGVKVALNQLCETHTHAHARTHVRTHAPTHRKVEWHPLYHQDELLEFCRKNEIILQAYLSLGGTSSSEIFNNPEVKKIADKLDKNVTQVYKQCRVKEEEGILLFIVDVPQEQTTKKECSLLLELWLKVTNREDLLGKSVEYLSKHYKICELHFQDKFVYQSGARKRLFANAFPSVFPHSQPMRRVTVLQGKLHYADIQLMQIKIVLSVRGICCSWRKRQRQLMPTLNFSRQVHSRPSVSLPCATAQIQTSMYYHQTLHESRDCD